jgi:hypothetical protein
LPYAQAPPGGTEALLEVAAASDDPAATAELISAAVEAAKANATTAPASALPPAPEADSGSWSPLEPSPEPVPEPEPEPEPPTTMNDLRALTVEQLRTILTAANETVADEASKDDLVVSAYIRNADYGDREKLKLELRRCTSC